MIKYREYGEVSEWLKEHAWKACKVARLSQVRILSSPPNRIAYRNWLSFFDDLLLVRWLLICNKHVIM